MTKGKTILIAGAGGYIGSKMVCTFLKKGYKIIALDRYFFGDVFLDLADNNNLKIVKDDIRFFDEKLLKGVDAVINLAAISNDPASELDPKITKSINYLGALRLAQISKKMKIPRYILSSSCSVYGAGKGVLTEESKLAPISEYAKSKIKAEQGVLSLADKNFSVTVLRLATVYGLSKRRMRFDLIINIMTLHAWKNKKIFVMGGGKQWRPLIYINDVIKTFERMVIETKTSKINSQIFNTGSNDQNFQVLNVANLFKKYFSELEIEISPDDPDSRSYNVGFDKIAKYLDFKVTNRLEDGIFEIKEALEKGEIIDDLRTKTLDYYRFLMEANSVLSSLKLNNCLF